MDNKLFININQTMVNYNKLIAKYTEGKNISLFLKNSSLSKEDRTRISYDLQSGKTIKNFNKSKRNKVSRVMSPMVAKSKNLKCENNFRFWCWRAYKFILFKEK